MRRMMIVVLSLTVFAAACKKDDAARVDPKTDPVAKTDPAQPTSEKTSDLLAGKDPAGATPTTGSSAPTADPAGKADPAAVAAGGASEEEMITLMEKMAVVVEKHGTNCVQLGTELKAFVASNRATLEKMKNLQETMSDQDKQAMGTRLAPRIMPLAAKLAPIMGCTSDPAFKAMLEDLPL